MIELVLLFFAIPLIAVIDSLVLGKHFACEKCGTTKDWKFYIVPTTLEILLFYAGIIIGLNSA